VFTNCIASFSLTAFTSNLACNTAQPMQYVCDPPSTKFTAVHTDQLDEP
jgi:hypothetical protein